MRSAFLLILIFMTLLPLSATANDAQLIMPTTPWMEDEDAPSAFPSSQDQDIRPKKISLADLERMGTTPRAPEQQEVRFNNRFLSADIRQEPSVIEALYSGRIIDELQQFGYELFANGTTQANALTTIPAGTVQDNYTLSSGDILNIVLRGQINSRQNYQIDNQGLLIVDDLPPIQAAGRTLREVQTDLQVETAKLRNTQVFTSLASVRQIGVLVIGHVKKPGRKTLTAFHSVMDALDLAGGIEKTGSLRQVKLIRSGKSYSIDLYQLLMGSGKEADRLLKDGDRLIIPPIGPTMAVAGKVKRPAIYELQKHQKISLHQALGLAGGVLTPGQSRYLKLEYTDTGEETVADISDAQKRIFGDGAILMIAQAEQKRTQEVQLSGHTRQPGSHDLKKAKTLSALINDEKILGNDIYPLIGVLERRDSKQLTKQLIAFSPFQVLHKKYDKDLEEGDKVRLFSMAQIRGLESDKNGLYQNISYSAAEDKMDSEIKDPVLQEFLKERAVFIRGAVRQAGAYPVVAGTNLENILAVAGGLSLEANTNNIELSARNSKRQVIDLNTQNPQSVSLQAGDTIRVNQKFHKVKENSITLLGEVNHPGQYDLMAGDTLSTLIERAGGLSEHAYPNGAIFSRAAERKREESRYKSQAQDLEMKLAASLKNTDEDKKPNMEQVRATQSLIGQLKQTKAVGRITVEADPAMLSHDPAQDILLEAGDKIFFPKRPLTVRVAGEVLSPAALQFRQGKAPLEYISESGGTTHYADKDRAFVIFPDGSAQPLRISAWNHQADFIPPGSTIIVPRDPEPFDFIESAGKVAQVLANLAISGLYIEAIGDDD